MAKGAISKKPRAPSKHSRAARRATSPSIDTDKSLKNVQRPPESIDNRPSILAIHHGAGVSKKQKKGRTLSSKARKRQEKAQDRAVAILERTEKKLDQSKDQSRTIQKRRRVWEDINRGIPADIRNNVDLRGRVDRVEASTDEWETDNEMNEAPEERGRSRTVAPANLDVKSAAEPVMNQDEGDEIL
ncbi:Alb1-domain-containing protein [Xylaria sp. CBS 124048]|nr:Alb1-domain-containing protein [Xylaria sp. CBS 124048]